MKRAALLVHGPLTTVGGVERYHQYLIKFLQDEGFKVEIYEPATVAVPFYIRRYFEPLFQYYFVGREIGGQLQNFDLILASGYTGGFLKGKRVVNVSHGSVKSYLKTVKSFYNRKFFLSMSMAIFFDRLSKKGKLCLSASPQVQAELSRDYGVGSLMVPFGIDTKHFSKNELGLQTRWRYGIDSRATVGAFVGRWDLAHKGLDRLIQIMKERSDVHWIIATNSQVAVEGVKNFTVLKDVSYEELPNMYSAADFSIQLSRYESFGFSFVESLSCSAPVISTPVGIATELYNDPLLGQLLIRNHERRQDEFLAEIHNKIDKLQDKSYREELGKRGRERIEEEFSLEAWKTRMRNVLRSIAAGAA